MKPNLAGKMESKHRPSEEQRWGFLEQIYANYEEVNVQQQEIAERRRKLNLEPFRGNKEDIERLLFATTPTDFSKFGDWDTFESVEQLIKKFVYCRSKNASQAATADIALNERLDILTNTCTEQKEYINSLQKSLSSVQEELAGLMHILRVKEKEFESMKTKYLVENLKSTHLQRMYDSLQESVKIDEKGISKDMRILIDVNKSMERENTRLRAALDVKSISSPITKKHGKTTNNKVTQLKSTNNTLENIDKSSTIQKITVDPNSEEVKLSLVVPEKKEIEKIQKEKNEEKQKQEQEQHNLSKKRISSKIITRKDKSSSLRTSRTSSNLQQRRESKVKILAEEFQQPENQEKKENVIMTENNILKEDQNLSLKSLIKDNESIYSSTTTITTNVIPKILSRENSIVNKEKNYLEIEKGNLDDKTQNFEKEESLKDYNIDFFNRSEGSIGKVSSRYFTPSSEESFNDDDDDDSNDDEISDINNETVDLSKSIIRDKFIKDHAPVTAVLMKLREEREAWKRRLEAEIANTMYLLDYDANIVYKSSNYINRAVGDDLEIDFSNNNFEAFPNDENNNLNLFSNNHSSSSTNSSSNNIISTNKDQEIQTEETCIFKSENENKLKNSRENEFNNFMEVTILNLDNNVELNNEKSNDSVYISASQYSNLSHTNIGIEHENIFTKTSNSNSRSKVQDSDNSEKISSKTISREEEEIKGGYNVDSNTPSISNTTIFSSTNNNNNNISNIEKKSSQHIKNSIVEVLESSKSEEISIITLKEVHSSKKEIISSLNTNNNIKNKKINIILNNVKKDLTIILNDHNSMRTEMNELFNFFNQCISALREHTEDLEKGIEEETNAFTSGMAEDVVNNMVQEQVLSRLEEQGIVLRRYSGPSSNLTDEEWVQNHLYDVVCKSSRDRIAEAIFKNNKGDEKRNENNNKSFKSNENNEIQRSPGRPLLYHPNVEQISNSPQRIAAILKESNLYKNKEKDIGQSNQRLSSPYTMGDAMNEFFNNESHSLKTPRNFYNEKRRKEEEEEFSIDKDISSEYSLLNSSYSRFFDKNSFNFDSPFSKKENEEKYFEKRITSNNTDIINEKWKKLNLGMNKRVLPYGNETFLSPINHESLRVYSYGVNNGVSNNVSPKKFKGNILEYLRQLQHRKNPESIENMAPIVYRYDFRTALDKSRLKLQNTVRLAAAYLRGPSFDKDFQTNILPYANAAKCLQNGQRMPPWMYAAIRKLRIEEENRNKKMNKILFRRISTNLRARRLLRNKICRGSAVASYIIVLWDKWMDKCNKKRSELKLEKEADLNRMLDLMVANLKNKSQQDNAKKEPKGVKNPLLDPSSSHFRDAQFPPKK